MSAKYVIRTSNKLRRNYVRQKRRGKNTTGISKLAKSTGEVSYSEWIRLGLKGKTANGVRAKVGIRVWVED